MRGGGGRAQLRPVTRQGRSRAPATSASVAARQLAMSSAFLRLRSVRRSQAFATPCAKRRLLKSSCRPAP
ncbi:hypothetical protein T484DRAFT_1932096 [Baffinella frigidus]|nr:hypothetical protein T484DRAFT_1932096 [Cryptophyta sp. CCMP2293]